LGFTQTWEYDNGGNITFRRKYAYTTGSLENLVPVQVHEMSGHGMHGLGDLFAEYDGQVMSYDAIGNPLYDGQWTYTWEHGRELKTMSRGATTWTYTYDANGMRTQRTDGYYTYSYIYNGSQLSQLTVVYDDSEHYEYYELFFTYSADGTPLTVTFGGCTYYYVTNIQGDVIAILDDIGRLVCRYVYDAWGNVTTYDERPDNIGYYNPLRYRGYVYDQDTNLYYLQSRYYSPEWCRFLNADAFVATGQGLTGNNTFAYCGNDPINCVDPAGTFLKKVGTFFKNVGAAIYKGVKKLAKATVESFQIEVGVGYGLGASAKVGPVKASVSAYQDGLTVGLKNNSTYTAIKGGAGISAQITKKVSVGLSTEYEHRFETDLVRNWDEHTTLSAPWNVYSCPQTIKDPLQFSFPIIKPIEGNLSQDLFVGISVEAHLGVGGHVTIGWDAKEFWRILTE